MKAYTNFVDYASAQPAWLPGEMVEECYGSDSAKAGNVQRTAAGWLIKDGDYRPATRLEAAGIDSMMVKMAEALAMFAGYDEIEAMEITLSSYEPVSFDADDAWTDWLDAMADDWADTYASARFGFALI